MTERVVITGVGAVTPLGIGAKTLADRWIAGEVAIADGSGRCSDFDPVDLLGRKAARRADRFTQFAVVAADEAIAQAGVGGESSTVDSTRVGCVIGTGIGGIGTIEDQHDVLRDRGAKQVSPLSVPLMMLNAAAGTISLRHRLLGPSFGVASACAAGSHAIGTSARMIAHGEAEVMVTGGSEAALTPLSRASFASMGALSQSGISRPFDARRDGFVMGEGAGVLVLESHAHAQARGAQVLGEILGYGASSDAHHITAPDPEGAGAVRAIAAALDDADLTCADIDYVNAHGTSTELNDRSETAALKAAFGSEQAHRVPVSSLKSAIGHLLGAAGAVEAIASILAMRARIAPPTLGYEQPDPELDLDYVPGEARPITPLGQRAVAMSNSFGFGGHNAVLILAA